MDRDEDVEEGKQSEWVKEKVLLATKPSNQVSALHGSATFNLSRASRRRRQNARDWKVICRDNAFRLALISGVIHLMWLRSLIKDCSIGADGSDWHGGVEGNAARPAPRSLRLLSSWYWGRSCHIFLAWPLVSFLCFQSSILFYFRRTHTLRARLRICECLSSRTRKQRIPAGSRCGAGFEVFHHELHEPWVTWRPHWFQRRWECSVSVQVRLRGCQNRPTRVTPTWTDEMAPLLSCRKVVSIWAASISFWESVSWFFLIFFSLEALSSSCCQVSPAKR